jgi:excinuclease ABC subunit B
MTGSMRHAIDETNRRRSIQEEWNTQRGITPQGIRKAIRDINDRVRAVAEEQAPYLTRTSLDIPKDELVRLIKDLEVQMKKHAQALEFEKAALVRDQVVELRGRLSLIQDEEVTRLGERISGVRARRR